MAYLIKLAPRAQRDLVKIYDWIGANSSDAARTWYGGLRNAILTLANNPNRCPVTPEDPELRHLMYGSRPYRVIYRVLERKKQVHVLHIRHGARQTFEAGDVA